MLIRAASFTITVVYEPNGFGAMVTAAWGLPVAMGDIPITPQPGGIVAVIAIVVNVPVVVSALPSRTTPVFKAPKAPLLHMIVPRKTE